MVSEIAQTDNFNDRTNIKSSVSVEPAVMPSTA